MPWKGHSFKLNLKNLNYIQTWDWVSISQSQYPFSKKTLNNIDTCISITPHMHITMCSVSVLHTVVVIVLYTYLLCFKYFRFYHSPISKFCGQQSSITLSLSKENESKWSGIFVAQSHLLPLWSQASSPWETFLDCL